MIVRSLTAAVVFLVALDGGSYGVASRGSLAILVWSTIGVAALVGILPPVRLARIPVAAASALGALALLSAASMAWAPSTERAFTEANRVSLYLGVFLLAVAAATAGKTAHVTDGLAIGLAAVGSLALGSRLFPDLFPADAVSLYLPSASSRLTYPLNYWNGLAILTALAVPLMLRAAVAARRRRWKSLAVAPLPVLGATIFLTGSRGGVAVAAVAVGVFLLVTADRARAALAVLTGAAGAGIAIAVLLAEPVLVDGPYDSAGAASAGERAALLIGLTCLATGLAYALGDALLERTGPIPRVARRLALAAALLLTVAAVVVAQPLDRFQEGGRDGSADSASVRGHLLSDTASKRLELWRSALDQFESAPLVGTGAGSYEVWWAEHRPVAVFARDAHSLYLETLGELGVVGLGLLTVFLVLVGFAVARRLKTSRGDERTLTAGVAAAGLAFLGGAALDWMWELTAVSFVGVALLGLAAASVDRPSGTTRLLGRFPMRIAAAAVALALICAQAVPVLAHNLIRESQTAAGREEWDEAVTAAGRARDLEPWAGSPYVQLALVQESAGDQAAARASIAEALEREPSDWRLWLVAARMQTKAGEIDAARASLARARELNPRSPLFSETRGGL